MFNNELAAYFGPGRKTKRLACGGMCIAVLLTAAPVLTASDTQYLLADLQRRDLATLTLEDLMNIEVVSVSKQVEPLQAAAAAIYVLTGEEIRRSGARTLPEVLRLVPGLTVARADSHSWAVTARGFNSTLADKLEVLMDGRTLYTPLFSGVFWDAHDTLLEDIDRIEVIRGPGAALWGSNAVNGVVNIVTKSAVETLGAVVEVGGGGEFEGFGAARYGGQLGEDGGYRAYAQTRHHKPQELVGPGDAEDRWHRDQAGFRTDFRAGEADRLTVQGDVYDSEINRGDGSTEENKGGNLLGRWTRTLNESSDLTVQVFYDRSERDNKFTFVEDRDTYDLDVKHRFALGERQEIVWGGGYRRSSDEIGSPNPALLSFDPRSRTTETTNLFAQNQIAVVPERLEITLGAKLEDNAYSGFEVQPSLRAAFTPDNTTTWWAAVSRALRIPNRADSDIVIQVAPGVTVLGSDDFEPEEVIAYEAGYRSLLTPTLSVDLALYYNEYDELRGGDFSSLPARVSNEGGGHGSGIETVLQWKPLPEWSLLISYNYQDLQVAPDSGSTDFIIENANRSDPYNQFMLRSLWSPAPNWEVDGVLRYVDELPDRFVDAYWQWDLRVAWSPFKNIELELVGRNLLDPVHPEFSSAGDPTALSFSRIEIVRSAHASVTWRFPR